MSDIADEMLDICAQVAVLQTWMEAVKGGLQEMTPKGADFYSESLNGIRTELENLAFTARRREREMRQYGRMATDALLQVREIRADSFPQAPMAPVAELPEEVIRFPGKLDRDIYRQNRRPGGAS
ncbi:hypothetical protein [Paradevosia shaoguanensis]|uniref:Uncharacterized protein n=1 Tax=Paradevosia shaoguanensis TaxID=1335043 RepID=A0AA41UCY9_9HYPH|nr:hypothetical protein [Paradevosia shaoguanensis]MCF1744650.1 hypothetical protein [Paradevosia shaoguanensis]MCI0129133.1 hypothetical protein [Paradevosia shaoguanensis]